jgi:hypothetical protein
MTGPAKGKEFSYTIATMRSGSADEAASSALKQLVEAVEATKGKGSVTVQLSIAPMKDGDGELEVKAKIKLTLPSVDIKTAIMYADEDFNLSKANPKQLSMLNEGNDRGTGKSQIGEESLSRVGRGSGDVIDITPNRHERPAI